MEDIIHIRLDPESRAALDRLVAAYGNQAVGTTTQSDVVRHAIKELDAQRGAS
jgi:Arc/MetJ-type ribon-helix-helix transcriptional regulator